MDESQSPTPIEDEGPKTLNFYEALKEMLDGKSITKIEWDSVETFGFMEKDVLILHFPNGKKQNWIISRADIVGQDWVVL
jgi:hypothetical protein